MRSKNTKKQMVSWASAILCAAAFAFAASADNKPAELTLAQITPLSEQPFNWTGMYLGFNVGGVWEHFDLGHYNSFVNLDKQFDQAVPLNPGEILFDLEFSAPGRSKTDTSAIGGGQIGYNQQFGHFVIGAEGGFSGLNPMQWTRFHGSQSGDTGIDSITFDTSFRSKRSVETYWDGYIGAQFGVAYGRFLFYGNGGAAFTGVQIDSFERASTDFFGPAVTPTPTPIPIPARRPLQSVVLLGGVTNQARRHDSDLQVGWYAGGGFQYALTDTIAAGVEYRHSDFGDETFGFGAPGPLFPGATNVSLDSDQVTFRLNILLGHLGH